MYVCMCEKHTDTHTCSLAYYTRKWLEINKLRTIDNSVLYMFTRVDLSRFGQSITGGGLLPVVTHGLDAAKLAMHCRRMSTVDDVEVNSGLRRTVLPPSFRRGRLQLFVIRPYRMTNTPDDTKSRQWSMTVALRSKQQTAARLPPYVVMLPTNERTTTTTTTDILRRPRREQ